MFRRNFFRIAGGALAALFVPKVAEAVVEKTTPYFDPEVLERAASGPWSEGCIYIAKNGLYQLDGNGEWEKLSQGFSEVSDSAWKPKT